MKKVFILVPCVAVVLMMSKVSFAEPEPAPVVDEPSLLSVANLIGEIQEDGTTVWRQASSQDAPQALPFGYPAYPTTAEGYPAYGIPYSYPQVPRRLANLGSRFAPPPIQPYALPEPGAVPGAAPLHVPPMVSPPFARGQRQALQGVLGAAQPAVVGVPMQPTVVYRPTPFRNFMALISAPRPYIGYDPYAYPVLGH
ncbi:MAG: hypothetical protein FWE95_01645 [Planctomycetaceae bacterium]|nr:hypothetical protein [Planctomycetaceae bacterium]